MPSVCLKGKEQSPINIKSENSYKCEGNCELFFYYRSSTCNILNNTNELILDYDMGSYILYNNIVYELDKISFMIPSGHKIDGAGYPIEILLYHKSTDFGKVLIVSVLCDVNDAVSKSKHFMDMLVNNLPRNSGDEKIYNTPEDWNAFHLIPEQKSFYTYTGSLPRDPCTESVEWVVMDNPINVSSSVYKNIRSVIGKNSRKLQKSHNRKVYFNPNLSNKCRRNYGSKLRCFTDEELRQTCSCMCKDGQNVGVFPNISGGIFFLLLCLIFITLCLVVCLQYGVFEFSLKKFRDFIQYQPDILNINNE